MSSADGRLTLVFNGAIYNYRELRADLGGYPFRSDGDSETILALYQVYGVQLFSKLRGMYALALWDELERRLILGRDPHGIKPLYYAVDNAALRFASQVKALERVVSKEIDPGGLTGFLLWGSVPEPLTLRKAIRSVPAGHYVEIRDGRVGMPEPHVTSEALRPAPLMDVPKALEDSVRAHLVADVPVGIFLSAGIDSALITALACRHLAKRPMTFTLAFDEFGGTALDEGPGARVVARAFGTDHIERRLTREDCDGLWSEALDAMDQPSIDGFNVFLMSRFAHEAGLKVVLAGIGGDELFGSYPSFVDVGRWQRWAQLLKMVPGIESAWPQLTSIAAHSRPKVAGFLQGTSLPRAYFLKRGLFLPREIPDLLGPDLAGEGLGSYSPVADATRALQEDSGVPGFRAPDGWEAVHRMETALYMRNQLLRDADWASMAHSLELRVPLVDAWLTKCARAAHFEPARSGGKKEVARQSAPELPPSVISRAKSGFMVPSSSSNRNGHTHWGLHGRSRALAVLAHFGVELQAARVARARTGWPGPRITTGEPSRLRAAGRGAPISKTREHQKGDRVLLSTLPPWAGGVRTMTEFVLDCLQERGFQPVLAYYVPYSVDPQLSVPAFALGRRTVREREFRDDQGRERHEIGAWLPEFEFMHYQPTHLWRNLVASCRFHLAVSGNCFAALPYARLQVPFVNWVATPWRDDRRERELNFSPWRRGFDQALVRPVATRIERDVLRAGTLLALSEYTRSRLDAIAGRPSVNAVLANPIDCALFRPDRARVVPWRVGFTGRLDDPRKNVALLLEAVGLCRQRGLPITAVLVGGDLRSKAREVIEQQRLEPFVEVHSHVAREELPALLQTFDCYVVPSTQEGLCIAALEAMACGCPVVSTRCGGPEEFVLDGQTGYLSNFSAKEVATAIERTIGDRLVRDSLSTGAKRLVDQRYGVETAKATFWRAFDETFAKA